MRKPFIALILFALFACQSKQEYPKVLVLGFVNQGFDLSVLDFNAGTRQYITNSKIISPSSYSYCEKNKQIVYSAPTANGDDLFLWGIDGSTKILTHSSNRLHDLIWSPDCSEILFDSQDKTHSLAIRDNQTRLFITNRDLLSGDASWSPDSKYVAIHISSNTEVEDTRQLGIVDASTGEIVDTVPGVIDYPSANLTWDANSLYLIFSMIGKNDFDLYKYDLKAKRASLLISTPNNDRFPVISPDGKNIAFLEDDKKQNTTIISILNFNTQQNVTLKNISDKITGLLWLNDHLLLSLEFNQLTNRTIFRAFDIRAHEEVEMGEWDGYFKSPSVFP